MRAGCSLHRSGFRVGRTVSACQKHADRPLCGPCQRQCWGALAPLQQHQPDSDVPCLLLPSLLLLCRFAPSPTLGEQGPGSAGQPGSGDTAAAAELVDQGQTQDIQVLRITSAGRFFRWACSRSVKSCELRHHTAKQQHAYLQSPAAGQAPSTCCLRLLVACTCRSCCWSCCRLGVCADLVQAQPACAGPAGAAVPGCVHAA